MSRPEDIGGEVTGADRYCDQHQQPRPCPACAHEHTESPDRTPPLPEPGTVPPPADDGLGDDGLEYDYVTAPPHYQGAVETIDLNENAPANLAAAFKYLDRVGKKPGEDTEEQIRKARWYLLREFMRQGWITRQQWEQAVGRTPAGQ